MTDVKRTVYDITGDYIQVLAMAEDPDMDPEVFRDTLEGIEGELEVKADAYARVIRQLEYESAAYDAESKALRNKKAIADKKIDKLKEMLKEAMVVTGKDRIKTGLFEFRIKNNRPSVVIDNLQMVPTEFLKFKEPEADKTAIYKALKDGSMADWAHLEPSTSLSIR